MNERIRELMPKPWTFPYPDRELYTKEQFEKFAELIVRECADFLDYRLTNPDGASMAWCDGSDIKEHFGVEELPVCKHDWYSAKNPVVQNGSVCVICGAIDAREPEELKNERTY